MARNQDNNSPPPLALNLFGPFEVRVHGVPLPRLHSRKGVWLLALLTLRQGKPVERDGLAGTLWPDSLESRALSYLRQSLTELRHALGTEATRLQTPTRQTLALDLAGAEVDVLTFDAGIRRRDRRPPTRRSDLPRTAPGATVPRSGRCRSVPTANSPTSPRCNASPMTPSRTVRWRLPSGYSAPHYRGRSAARGGTADLDPGVSVGGRLWGRHPGLP